MTAPEDPHAVLGLPPDATRAQVVRAFRALACRLHPDVPGGDRAAYARVRRAYDLLTAPSQDTGSSPTGRGRAVRIPVRVRKARPRRGADVSATVRLGLGRAVHGGTVVADPGDGRRVVVTVPAGIRDGTRLRLRDRGLPGAHGGPPGDLLVTVRVDEHPAYRRTASDLRATLVLAYTEAVLGTDAVITALDGREITVPVPPGTVPGSTITLPGEGVPSSGGARGDLVLDVTVDVPTGRLSPDQRAALERLDRVLPAPRKEPRR
ncbi:DnaJ C-terminal domain-containing protein [Nocardiopsis sp. FIRDI 009]|uniref:J domain-containing protein n=1 Tax=Nocardiopsis sp. FIRDI 009 TaxID=714197 RepID=UPI000E227423|nr:DnaJ C-terminal domain-containing protein [Nocardiopsis sp. FIRDI 009]